MPETNSQPLIPPHGGYRTLQSYRCAERVYDATVLFCDRFVDKRSRTHDQMVQAARSGVQNIAEGSVASGTSKKTELKLTNVARASLEELLLDYQDFLRQRGMRLWAKDSEESARVRSSYQAVDPGSGDPYGIGSAKAETAANTLVCLISQACYLLDRQLQTLQRQFVEQGGFTERLYNVRKSHREAAETLSDSSNQSNSSNRPDADAPACPQCGKPMVSRVARQGANTGQSFWGCSGYPACKGTRKLT
jgi:restriction system protein